MWHADNTSKDGVGEKVGEQVQHAPEKLAEQVTEDQARSQA